MNSIDNYAPSESLHRLVKQVIDAGEVGSITEAEARFKDYQLALEITGPSASEPIAQATLLTAVALGIRVFLGGVSVSGELDCQLSTPRGFGTNSQGGHTEAWRNCLRCKT